VEYFYETYGFVIQHPQWPCLQVGNQQRPNYLPMEVIHISSFPLCSQFMGVPAYELSLENRSARLLRVRGTPKD